MAHRPVALLVQMRGFSRLPRTFTRPASEPTSPAGFDYRAKREPRSGCVDSAGQEQVVLRVGPGAGKPADIAGRPLAFGLVEASLKRRTAMQKFPHRYVVVAAGDTLDDIELTSSSISAAFGAAHGIRWPWRSMVSGNASCWCGGRVLRVDVSSRGAGVAGVLDVAALRCQRNTSRGSTMRPSSPRSTCVRVSAFRRRWMRGRLDGRWRRPKASA